MTSKSNSVVTALEEGRWVPIQMLLSLPWRRDSDLPIKYFVTALEEGQ